MGILPVLGRAFNEFWLGPERVKNRPPIRDFATNKDGVFLFLFFFSFFERPYILEIYWKKNKKIGDAAVGLSHAFIVFDLPFFFFSFCYFFFIRTRHVGHGEFDWLVAVFFFLFFCLFFFKFSGRNWVGVQKKKTE